MITGYISGALATLLVHPWYGECGCLSDNCQLRPEGSVIARDSSVMMRKPAVLLRAGSERSAQREFLCAYSPEHPKSWKQFPKKWKAEGSLCFLTSGESMICFMGLDMVWGLLKLMAESATNCAFRPFWTRENQT